MKKKKKMSEERALFCQAICEGLVQKYEAEMALCPEHVQCSEVHLRKMNEIIEGHARAARIARMKQRIAAAMVAAALLVLTACTVYAYRGEIKELFVKMREAYIKLFYDEAGSESDGKITEYYTLGYVPEGYELVHEMQGISVGEYTWSDGAGNSIVFEQFMWDGTIYSVDSETGETTMIVCGTMEVYYRVTKLHTYIWNNGTYSFMLTASRPLSLEELEKILESVAVIE